MNYYSRSAISTQIGNLTLDSQTTLMEITSEGFVKYDAVDLEDSEMDSKSESSELKETEVINFCIFKFVEISVVVGHTSHKNSFFFLAGWDHTHVLMENLISDFGLKLVSSPLRQFHKSEGNPMNRFRGPPQSIISERKSE